MVNVKLIRKVKRKIELITDPQIVIEKNYDFSEIYFVSRNDYLNLNLIFNQLGKAVTDYDFKPTYVYLENNNVEIQVDNKEFDKIKDMVAIGLEERAKYLKDIMKSQMHSQLEDVLQELLNYLRDVDATKITYLTKLKNVLSMEKLLNFEIVWPTFSR